MDDKWGGHKPAAMRLAPAESGAGDGPLPARCWHGGGSDGSAGAGPLHSQFALSPPVRCRLRRGWPQLQCYLGNVGPASGRRYPCWANVWPTIIAVWDRVHHNPHHPRTACKLARVLNTLVMHSHWATYHSATLSFFVWRKHEDMFPCTGSRVNTNYERIASWGGRTGDPRILETPFATHCFSQRLNHSPWPIRQNGLAPAIYISWPRIYR